MRNHDERVFRQAMRPTLCHALGEVRMGSGVASRVDVADIVRKKWADFGYSGADKITVINHIQVQSPELAASSDTNGAGDQGFASYGLNEV